MDDVNRMLLVWDSLKLYPLHIMNASEGAELIAFVRQCFRNIHIKPHISSINDFIATEILSNLFS